MTTADAARLLQWAMAEPGSFRYLTSEEFFRLSHRERAEYLERVKEHLAALEEAHRHESDLKRKR